MRISSLLAHPKQYVVTNDTATVYKSVSIFKSRSRLSSGSNTFYFLKFKKAVGLLLGISKYTRTSHGRFKNCKILFLVIFTFYFYIFRNLYLCISNTTRYSINNMKK